jgi:hypothetical protein
MNNSEWHTTFRYLAILGTILLLAFFWWPEHRPQNAQNPEVQSLVQTLQSFVDADRTRASLSAQAPTYEKPAVTVIHDAFPGITPGQIAALLAATKPRYAPAYSAKYVPPSPQPSPTPNLHFTADDVKLLQQIDYNATQQVISNTKVALNVTQQAVPPGRVGVPVTTDGSGISYALRRRGRFDFEVGVLQRGSHVSPSLGVTYNIPGTQLAGGPVVTFDHGVRLGVGLTIKM